MEILQTIWSALTTENELLTNILGIPSIFVECLVSVLLFTSIFNIDSTKNQKIIYICIVSTVGFITRFFVPTPYSTYINIIIMLLSVKYIFNINFFKAFGCMAIPFLLTAILESVFAKIYFLIFNQDYSAVLNLPLQRFVMTFIMLRIIILDIFINQIL